MDITTENLRYLLWREDRFMSRHLWPEQLAQWAGCSRERANHLLHHGGPSPTELARIAEVLHEVDEDLILARLVEREGVDILRENVRYLIWELGRGGPAHLAKALDVGPPSVSQWAAGTHTPTEKRIQPLCDFFGIARSSDLKERPFFLSLEPVTNQARREWLKQRLDLLEPELLQELYPALRRLLEERS